MKTKTILFYAFTLVFSMVFMLSGGEKLISLEPGEPAPDIIANDQNGELWQLQDYLNKKFVVIDFYPAAMTGGCTNQACSYRDQKDELSEMDVEVVGISGDPVKNLKIFQDAHQLNFTLLSDVNGTIARKYGVPTKAGGSITRTVDNQELVLKRSASAARWTFIVNPQGEIVYKNTEVNARSDSRAVIDFIKKLKK